MNLKIYSANLVVLAILVSQCFCQEKAVITPWTQKQETDYKHLWFTYSSLSLFSKEKTGSTLKAFKGFETFSVSAKDGWNISGWTLPAKAAPRGTVLVVHGFLENAYADNSVVEPALWLSQNMDFNVCCPNLRFHGSSGNGIPTYGVAESWDLKAAVDYCKQKGFLKPYFILATSLGAMAATHAVRNDSRISGAVLIMPPASPRLAIKNNPGIPDLIRKRKEFSDLAESTNTVYGYDIFAEGDLSTAPMEPSHKPKVLYIMANDDPFDFSETKKVWNQWYPKEKAEFNKSPLQAPKQSKWFIERTPADNIYGSNGLGHGMSPFWPRDNVRVISEFFQLCVPWKQ